jgi:hypothetical protein
MAELQDRRVRAEKTHAQQTTALARAGKRYQKLLPGSRRHDEEEDDASSSSSSGSEEVVRVIKRKKKKTRARRGWCQAGWESCGPPCWFNMPCHCYKCLVFSCGAAVVLTIVAILALACVLVYVWWGAPPKIPYQSPLLFQQLNKGMPLKGA